MKQEKHLLQFMWGQVINMKIFENGRLIEMPEDDKLYQIIMQIENSRKSAEPKGGDMIE